MSLDYLPSHVDLPFDRHAYEEATQDEKGDMLQQLVFRMTELLQTIHLVANNSRGLTQVQWHYFSLPDPATGQYPDRSIRLGIQDDSVQVQCYSGGQWQLVTVIGA